VFVRNTLDVMLVAKGENQLALAIDSTVLLRISVLDLVRLIPHCFRYDLSRSMLFF
jgi:hypothetical protein